MVKPRILSELQQNLSFSVFYSYIPKILVIPLINLIRRIFMEKCKYIVRLPLIHIVSSPIMEEHLKQFTSRIIGKNIYRWRS